MTNIRLQNIARLSVLYLGCLIAISTVSKIGLNDNWSVGAGIFYFSTILVLEIREIFGYFRGITTPAAYAFMSLIVANYAFNLTIDQSHLSIFGYLMISNFVFSCGYLIYSLHTVKPHNDVRQR